VHDDFYNWPNEIGGLIDANKAAAVVVMIGGNDRQQMTLAGGREPVRSPAWTAEYERRARALAAAVTSRNLPLAWIGAVPVRSEASAADMLALNGIFRTVSENPRANAGFVDVWDGFVDETGRFVERGPDMNGQTVALRTGQVNITKAGYRKIAFFAERALNRLLGDSGPRPGMESQDLPALSLTLPGKAGELEKLRPVDLFKPDATAENGLMGATVAPVAAGGAKPQPGRIDDFRLPAPRP
jgi:uncharacterized protein